MNGRRRVAAFVVSALLAAGCARGEGVIRVVDDRPIRGPFVPAEAYAAYLRGAVAEASGDLGGAVEGYSVAVALGPRDPEPWTRLGDARCARAPGDPEADDALAHALAIDGDYAPAWDARARCALRRGDTGGARRSAKRATEVDPTSFPPLESLAEVDRRDADAVRDRLVAMTLASPTDSATWRALAAWARVHGDAPLQVGALARLARLDPATGREIDSEVGRLAGEGEIVAARSLARARTASMQLGATDPLVARLAVDDALLGGALPEARRLAARGHLPLVVIAARAVILGQAAVARAIAAQIVAADPRATDARLVLAAAGEVLGDRAGVAMAFDGGPARPAAAVAPDAWLCFARVVSREGSSEAARAMLAALPRDAMLTGDPLTTPLAVTLVERAVLSPADLDANGRVELAARRNEPSSEADVAAADPRHRLLALAGRSPLDPRTLALAQRLAPARARDPLVAVSFARLSLAGAPGAPEMVAVLARLDPTDPLVAAAARAYRVRRN